MQDSTDMTKCHAFIDGFLCGLSTAKLIDDTLVEKFIESIPDNPYGLQEFARSQWARMIADRVDQAIDTVEVILYTP
jgi:hypothetical protein